MEKVIKQLQQFINKPFTYEQMIHELERQRTYLMQPSVIDNTPQREYNSAWNMVLYLEAYFEAFNGYPYMIVSNQSVQSLYNQFYNAKYNTPSGEKGK